MRIISKHHDYYDGVMKQLCDRSVTFVRNSSDPIDCQMADQMGSLYPQEATTDRNSLSDFIYPGLIYFCGKTFVFLKFCNRFFYNDADTPDSIKKESLSNWLTEQAIFNTYRWYDEKPRFKVKADILRQYSLKNGVAYFSITCFAYHDRNKIIHYPNLKEYEFYKVMPPVEAFQKIQAYLTNDLAREKQMPIPPITNKTKAEIHGFDKYSFRKDPSTKKRKK